MPDEFVPLDTTKYTRFHRELAAKSVIINQNLRYIDNNRKKLRSLYPAFDRFDREDLSHNSEVAGNGLGLAIARTIVQAHKGHIRAESHFGRDATFIVTLPG